MGGAKGQRVKPRYVPFLGDKRLLSFEDLYKGKFWVGHLARYVSTTTSRRLVWSTSTALAIESEPRLGWRTEIER